MRKKIWKTLAALAGILVIGGLLWLNYKIIPRADQPVRQEPDPDSAYYAGLNFANEPLPVADHYVKKRVKRVLRNFSYQKLKTYKLHQRASRLFPIMEPILAKYGIPEDFKYIPLVESGLKSGTSHKGASGLWQFMPETARMYGLKVSGAIDERHKVEKSTIAACKYLRRLHKEFGNWTLVAAAYNIGDNKLKRLIRQQKQDSYFSIRFNPETAIYVYRLVAMKEIIEQPARHGYVKAAKSSYAINPSYPRYYPDNLLRGALHTRSRLN